MDTRKDLSIIIPNHREKDVYLVESTCKYLYPNAEIIVSNDFEGKGKGWALREGFNKSTKKIVIFIDGDFDISPYSIKTLLPKIENYDVVIATKKLDVLSLKRKLISNSYRWLVRFLFRLPLTDTQTGLKIYERYSLLDWKTNGFACDIEMLYNAYKGGFRICEVPIGDIRITKAKGIKAIWNTFWETMDIWYRVSFRHTRDKI